MLAETEGILFGHVQDVLDESVNGRLAPVADGENERVLAGLGGVLVLEEGRNGASRVAVSGEIASSGETVSSGEITILQ